MTFEPAPFVDDLVTLAAGRPRLSVRRWGARIRHGGPAPSGGRTFVLVHGLASNAHLWDGVAAGLADLGHPSIAVDLRGHGRSEVPGDGYDTDTCADDVAALLDVEQLTGDAAPVVVGQSWGGNVVLSLAARHPDRVAGVACVDGGWIRLRDSFATFADCWAALAPPRFDGTTYAGLAELIRSAHPDWPEAGIAGTLDNLVELPDGGVRARLSRTHHESIVRSLFEGDPHAWYPKVTVPVLLVPAVAGAPAPGEDARQASTRDAVRDALAALPQGDVRWYAGADHDLHAQFPERLAADLAALADLAAAPPHDHLREDAR